jgi:hypothetical protein
MGGINIKGWKLSGRICPFLPSETLLNAIMGGLPIFSETILLDGILG